MYNKKNDTSTLVNDLSNKKVVFFDIDGTILDENKEIPVSTKMAVKELQKQGTYVAIATGRGPSMFQPIMKELGMSSFVSFNGSYVVFDGNVVYKNPLSKENMLLLEESALAEGHPMVFLNEKEMYANHQNHHFILESMGSIRLKHPTYHATFHQENDIYQALLFLEEKNISVIKDAHNHFDYVRWHEKAIDVLPKGGSKARGIQEILKKLNIPVENTYAFGDALNDLEMLKFVGHGVAMGNGVPEAKRVADYITDDVGNDGIYKGLLALGLLKDN